MGQAVHKNLDVDHVTAVGFGFGRPCYNPGSFQGAIHAFLTSDDFPTAVQKTIRAGGCCRMLLFTLILCRSHGWRQVRLGWYSQRVDGQDDQCGKGSRRCHQRFQRLKMGTNSVSTSYWKSKYIFILSFLVYYQISYPYNSKNKETCNKK